MIKLRTHPQIVIPTLIPVEGVVGVVESSLEGVLVDDQHHHGHEEVHEEHDDHHRPLARGLVATIKVKTAQRGQNSAENGDRCEVLTSQKVVLKLTCRRIQPRGRSRPDRG